MTGRDRDEHAHQQAPHVPWHHRTSTVLGVSMAGLAALAIVVMSIIYVSRQVTEPQQAPLNYVGPTSSATSTRTTATTTGTITSTRPPITSDINPDLTPSSTDSSLTSSRNPNYRPPRTRESDGSEPRTTRSRPGTSVTATLNPAR